MVRAVLLVIIALLVGIVTMSGNTMGQSKSGSIIQVAKTRAAFDSESKKLTALVDQHFEKLQKSPLVQNDVELASQLAAERIDFDKSFELPLSILPSIRKRFLTARTNLLQAYTKAIAGCEPGSKTVERENLEKELQAFKARTQGLDIDGEIAARVGASLGATNKYQLNKKMAQRAQQFNAKLVLLVDQTFQEVDLGEVLPSIPFVISEIHFPFGVAINDNDMLQLSTLNELSKLTIRDSKITDVGIKHISALRNLKAINCHATKITNSSLFLLVQMGTLEEIDLGYNDSITDDGIRALGALSKLRSLNYGSPNVSPEMVRWIQTKLTR